MSIAEYIPMLHEMQSTNMHTLLQYTEGWEPFNNFFSDIVRQLNDNDIERSLITIIKNICNLYDAIEKGKEVNINELFINGKLIVSKFRDITNKMILFSGLLETERKLILSIFKELYNSLNFVWTGGIYGIINTSKNEGMARHILKCSIKFIKLIEEIRNYSSEKWN